MRSHLTQPSQELLSSNRDFAFLQECLSAVSGINAPVLLEPQDPQDAGGRAVPTILGEFRLDGKTAVNRNDPSFLHLDDFRTQDPHKPKISDVAVAALWFNQRI